MHGSWRSRVPRRSLTIGLAACALAGAAPAAASAATYCVHQPADPCAPGATDEGADLQAALDLAEANSNADTIQIGPGTFAPTINQGFTYLSSNPVDIVGAGRGQTTITDRGHATQTLTLGNNTTGPRTITLSHLSVAPAGLTSFVVVLSGGT